VIPVPAIKPQPDLAAVAQRSRRPYAACVAGMPSAPPWWTAVVITASSVRQAERYPWEIHRREEAGKIPPNVRFLVVPDLWVERLSSGLVVGSGDVILTFDADSVDWTRPGDPFAIPRTALHMTGLFLPQVPLAEVLAGMGGGVEIKTAVDLPIGSGLGTSSILAATTLRALAKMMSVEIDDQSLSDHVMRLEQLMATGGGWQDQAGGIFPGATLVASGPGLHQRLRVEPVPWTDEGEAEFERLTLLFYTGIRRVARDLLQQVVGSYLGRETACVQVLHSIKTLAMEMPYAMREGDWDYLGNLLDRHWELNRLLDPITTNAPINLLLEAVRPFTRGMKLAHHAGGAIHEGHVAREGLRVLRR
jgi:mevalonate kinase